MDQGLVEGIKGIVERGIVQDIDGVKYSPVSLKKVVDDCTPEPIKLNTLGGLCAYLSSEVDQHSEETKLFIVVSSHQCVELAQSIDFKSMDRHCFVRVTLDAGKEFPFGSFLDNEDFLIRLRSQFVKTNDRENLLRFASRISTDESLKTLDDGVSQSIAVSRGVSGALKENETAPCIVSLAPFRTFREIEQPDSQFIFRMRGGRNEKPSCALFEADGGAWRLEAVNRIAKWLSQNVKKIPVLY